jgi:triphosphoribosyl-dephospho-CoA synthase
MPAPRSPESFSSRSVPSDAVEAVAGRVPSSLRPGGVGWCVAVACLLEATAPKPGNVHPAASFPDLTFADLTAAAVAIAPIFDRAAARPLGKTVLEAVRASRGVTPSNANLGIILALAPLAGSPEGLPPRAAMPRPLDPGDARDVWEAIRLAAPGGMGSSSRHDLAGPPPEDLLAAMRLAASRDQIAALWADGYGSLVDGLVGDLADEFVASASWQDAIVRGFLRQLGRAPDSLIVRRHGAEVAAEVSARAAAVIAAPGDGWRSRAAAFDVALRDPVRINPGTTADLVAAALYILLRRPEP